MSVGDALMGALYGNPINEAYGVGGGQPGGLVGGIQRALGGGGGAPQMAPAQATQSTPDLQQSYNQLANPNIAQLYLRQEQLNRASDQFDKGLEGLVLSKTPSMLQPGVMASMGPTPRTDVGTELQNLMALQQHGMQMQGFAQLMSGLPTVSQMSGIDQGTLRGIAMMDPQAYEKIVETYGGIGGGQDQDYMRAMAKARMAHPGASNQQIMQIDPWLTNATTFNKTTQDAAEAKANAMQSYPTLKETANTSEMYLNKLADPTNHAALMLAIQNPNWSSANVAKWANLIPAEMRPNATSDQVTQMRNALDWLKTNLQTTKFAGTKNVRSLQEFAALGNSATLIDKPTNDDSTVIDEINRLQDNGWRESANLDAEAGKKVDASHAGLADSQYFNSEHPLYNGASEGQLKKPPDALAEEAKAGIARDPRNRHAVQMQFRQMGYDPSGL